MVLFLGLYLGHRKLLASGFATLLTGLGRLGGSGSPFVTECFGLVTNVGVSAVAGIGSIAAVFAIGRGNLCAIIVTKRFGLVANVDVSAVAGIGSVAAVYAIGCGNLCAIVVSERFGLVTNVGVSAVAGIGSVAAVYTIGCGNLCAIIVAECFGLVTNVGVSAVAGVGSVATVFAIGCGNLCAIVVAECGNGLLRNEDITADCALLTLGQAAFGAGGRFSLDNLLAMLGAKVLTAYVANVVDGVAIGVTKRGNYVLSNECIVAYGTNAAVGQAGLGAGRILAFYGLGAVTESCGLTVGVAMSASLAGMGSIAAVFAIGLGYFIVVVVSELCNLLGVGVRRIVLTGIGLYALVGAGGC